MTTPLLRLSDGTTTITFADESAYDRSADNYFLLEDGFGIPPPEPVEVYAASANRDGAPLTNVTYPNRQVVIPLKIRGDSKPEMERNAARIQDLLRTAREDALLDRSRVYLEYQITGGVSRVNFDVLGGHLALPDRLLALSQLNANQMREAVLTLTCKPFCRGYERALAKAQSAIPREDTDPATDEGIGIFGDATNLCLNPVFYANVTDGWTTAGAPDEFARYTNVKDSAGITMPTAARLRADGAGQLARATNTGTVSAGDYTISTYLRGRGLLTLAIATDGAGGNQTSGVITLTDAWTRHSFTATMGAGATYMHAEVQYSSGYLDCFIAKVMLAKESFRSPFVPEAEYWGVNSAGTGTIYQLAPGHIWNGTVHNSTSSRSGVDAAGTTMTLTPTGITSDAGWTFAAWVKARGWAWNTATDTHHILTLGAYNGADSLAFYVDYSDDSLKLEVRDIYNLYKIRYSAAQTLASDVWVHAAFTVADDGTLAVYLNGTVAANTSDAAGATGRIETMPTTWYIGSDTDGTNPWIGFIQVQSILPYAATATQVAALYNAGRDGNKLAYIEPNNGANFDGSNADANRGTQTFTNLNGRVRLRDVQGQMKAPVRLRVYNNTATAYGFAWLGHDRFIGVPVLHVTDITPQSSQADVNALGDSYAQIASLSTSAVETMGTFTLVSTTRQQQYRVLMRASGMTAGDYFTATLYMSTIFPFYSKVLASQAGAAIYDLGVVTFPPQLVRREKTWVFSRSMSLYAGKCTSAGQILNVDYLIWMPVDQEVYWDDPRDARWETDYEPYLAIDTRDDQLLIMSMVNDESVVSNYLSGIKGDVLQLQPGDSHLAILGIQLSSGWGWGDTWQIDSIRYAPRYLVPPGL